MADWVSLTVSGLALIVSFGTYWATHLKQGQVLMTKPTIFCFGWDGTIRARPKIFLRCLLFSTARSGRILENLYLLVHRDGQTYCFDFWGHTLGNDGNSLTRGSGLFVSQDGLPANHHFNPDGFSDGDFNFLAGNYVIEVLCRQFGDTMDRKIGRYELELSESLASVLKKGDRILWTLNAEKHSYRSERFTNSHGLENYVESIIK
jgi:hypothetical protein